MALLLDFWPRAFLKIYPGECVQPFGNLGCVSTGFMVLLHDHLPKEILRMHHKGRCHTFWKSSSVRLCFYWIYGLVARLLFQGNLKDISWGRMTVGIPFDSPALLGCASGAKLREVSPWMIPSDRALLESSASFVTHRPVQPGLGKERRQSELWPPQGPPKQVLIIIMNKDDSFIAHTFLFFFCQVHRDFTMILSLWDPYALEKKKRKKKTIWKK